MNSVKVKDSGTVDRVSPPPSRDKPFATLLRRRSHASAQRRRHEVKFDGEVSEKTNAPARELREIRVTDPPHLRPIEELAQIDLQRGSRKSTAFDQQRSITILGPISMKNHRQRPT